jgi:sulfide:quinone oxidoreductase
MQQDYLQMRVLEVAPEVYACGPLFESDLKLLAKQGVRSIVYTRPDDESPGQPSSKDLERAAGEFGIEFVYQPVDAGPISSESAADFVRACEGVKRPLFVCSHSGGRATTIWETAELL